MLYVALCILANVTFIMLFRAFPGHGVNTFHAIVVNYFVCVVTGLVFIGDLTLIQPLSLPTVPVIMALALGVVAIFGFVFMAQTAQQLGTSVVSIASKMALVVPVCFSLFIFQYISKTFTIFNYAGLVLALPAIFMSAYKPQNIHVDKRKANRLLALPLAVFLIGGFIDTSMTYINRNFLDPIERANYPIYIFFVAAMVGLLMVLFKREKINWRSWVAGVALGIPNYFSLYFLLSALEAFESDGAVLFPINNIGIILFSTLGGIVLFGERISSLNFAGLVLSVIVIVLVSYQELFQFIF
jgi:hypothetical protein